MRLSPFRKGCAGQKAPPMAPIPPIPPVEDHSFTWLWELGGIVAGFSCCLCIAAQVMTEWTSEKASSPSVFHVFGFLLVFIFRRAYGLHFSRPAIWLTNGLSSLLQLLLLPILR